MEKINLGVTEKHQEDNYSLVTANTDSEGESPV